jgi:hypothetical protein
MLPALVSRGSHIIDYRGGYLSERTGVVDHPYAVPTGKLIVERADADVIEAVLVFRFAADGLSGGNPQQIRPQRVRRHPRQNRQKRTAEARLTAEQDSKFHGEIEQVAVGDHVVAAEQPPTHILEPEGVICDSSDCPDGEPPPGPMLIRRPASGETVGRARWGEIAPSAILHPGKEDAQRRVAPDTGGHDASTDAILRKGLHQDAAMAALTAAVNATERDEYRTAPGGRAAR